MSQYYYVGTLLPSLSFDSPPEISLEKLEVLLRDNLNERDIEKTLVLRQFYNILNLRALWQKKEFDPRGSLSHYEMDDALVSRIGLPDYIFDFLDRYPKTEDRLYHFPLLLAQFFQHASRSSDPFLRNYLSIEREMRLVMTAFRAHQLGRDLKIELQYEDPEEELIAQLLAQQDAKTYEPPEKYKDLKNLFDKYSHHPMALQKALDQYRFDKVDDMVDMADLFSIERILAYLVQYMIVEKWSELDADKGNQIIDKIVLG